MACTRANSKREFRVEMFCFTFRTVRLTSIHYRVSGYQKFCFAPTETIDRQVKKIRSPTCGMVCRLVLAEIYLVVDYLGITT